MEEKKLKLIGYWNNSRNEYPQYPNPSDLINPEFYEMIYEKYYIKKEYIAYYLDGGIVCNRYRGSSGCRICGKTLGTHERHNNTYIWPDQFSHYVLEHDVMLPESFIYSILSSDRTIGKDETEWTIHPNMVENQK